MDSEKRLTLKQKVKLAEVERERVRRGITEADIPSWMRHDNDSLKIEGSVVEGDLFRGRKGFR